MVYAAHDRFERGEAAPPDAEAPPPGTPLFTEIVDWQFGSFGPLWTVPLRFWLAALGDQTGRDRETARAAWPAIRADIDSGKPSMIGLIRAATANPLARNLGHQVVGYSYDETPLRVAIGVYDPNYPGDDTVEISFERSANGGLDLRQSTGERLLGVLHLPWRSTRRT